jgi:hypothetical protein
LECFLNEDDEVIMILDSVLTKLLLELDPNIKTFVDSDGRVCVKLKKALYGCIQSSKLWYEKLRGVLLKYGFIQNDHDPCVFNKMMNGSQVTVAFHVDDLLVTSVSDDNIDYVIKCLKENFTEITVNKGNKHSFFLGNKY